MSTITPTSSLAIALVKLRELVAASAIFQAAVDAGSAEDALPRIELDYVESDGLYLKRPFAVVCETDHTYQQVGEGDGIDLHGGGQLMVQLTANAEHPENHTDSKIAFVNFAAGVIDEMKALSGKDVYFPARSIELATFPQRIPFTERNEQRDYWWCEYLFNWGALG